MKRYGLPRPPAEDFLPYSIYSYCAGDPINASDKDAWGHGNTTFYKTEIYATHIENMIRAEHGQPLRTHYSYAQDTDGLRYPAFKILAKRKSLYFDSEGKSTYIKLNKNQTPYVY